MIVVIMQNAQVQAAYTNSPSDPSTIIVKDADVSARGPDLVTVEPVRRDRRLVNEVIALLRSRGEDV
uniref:Uncharacterized protein n=1 Tax=viral metagenome TaxID=1070528 RepID=A0A6M3LBX4_9ZZZZ